MSTAPVRRIPANDVSHAIITAAMKVHTELGPGLLESTHTACLQYQPMKLESTRQPKSDCRSCITE
jgi:hypothetical protein